MNLEAKTPQTIIFSAQDEQSFGAYHDLYASGTTVERMRGRRFAARLSAYRFPGLLVFNRSVSGASHYRDMSRVRRDGFEHINLQVLRSGRMAAGLPGEEQRMEAGDIVVFDTSRPQRTVVDRADYVSLAIARSEIEKIVPSIEHFHGRILPPAAAGLLSDFILTLGRRASSIGRTMSGPATVLAGEMLAQVISQETPTPTRRSETEEPDLHRWRADAFIKANLDDPVLSPDIVAAAAGVSRTALFRAFAPVGGVAKRILALRLARLRRALLRPGETRSIAELALGCGFVEGSSCYRAFKTAFGVTPGQMRTLSREEWELHASRDASQGWGDWWTDIA